jgi:hypothetical protein
VSIAADPDRRCPSSPSHCTWSRYSARWSAPTPVIGCRSERTDSGSRPCRKPYPVRSRSGFEPREATRRRCRAAGSQSKGGCEMTWSSTGLEPDTAG